MDCPWGLPRLGPWSGPLPGHHRPAEQPPGPPLGATGSHKPLKIGPGGPANCGPVPRGQGQCWCEARNPHPLPCNHTGVRGGGLRDHRIPTPGLSQEATAKAAERNVSNRPPGVRNREKRQEGATHPLASDPKPCRLAQPDALLRGRQCQAAQIWEAFGGPRQPPAPSFGELAAGRQGPALPASAGPPSRAEDGKAGRHLSAAGAPVLSPPEGGQGGAARPTAPRRPVPRHSGLGFPADEAGRSPSPLGPAPFSSKSRSAARRDAGPL